MKLQEVFEELGYETLSYSGRGMFGKRCLGVSISENDFNSLFILGMKIGASKNVELQQISSARTDSFGKEIVLYFPGISYEETSVEELEDLNI